MSQTQKMRVVERTEMKEKEGKGEQSKKEKDVEERPTYEPKPPFPQKLAQ